MDRPQQCSTDKKKDDASSAVTVKNWDDFAKLQELMSKEKTKRTASEISPQQDQISKKYCS